MTVLNLSHLPFFLGNTVVDPLRDNQGFVNRKMLRKVVILETIAAVVTFNHFYNFKLLSMYMYQYQ